MASANRPRTGYDAPRYFAAGDPAFYHVLHGAVPGHQIDFIYRPTVPQGPLRQTHFNHADRLIRYLEPRDRSGFAFAIGNLSRDDSQHEPGHGGLAILLCRRAQGVIDHAGRAMPPFAHGLLAVDRALDRGCLAEAAIALHRRFLDEGRPGTDGGFYREYVRRMRASPRTVEPFLAEHVARFADLPAPARSDLGADFLAREGTIPPRVTVVLPDDTPFAVVAGVAAALGSVLYRSNVKWTTISTGRDLDIPGGVSVRLVTESEAPRDGQGPVHRLADLPDGEAEIAEELFSARPRRAGAPERSAPRDHAARRATPTLVSAGSEVPSPRIETPGGAAGWDQGVSMPVALPVGADHGVLVPGALPVAPLVPSPVVPAEGAEGARKPSGLPSSNSAERTPGPSGKLPLYAAGAGLVAAAVTAAMGLWLTSREGVLPPASLPGQTRTEGVFAGGPGSTASVTGAGSKESGRTPDSVPTGPTSTSATTLPTPSPAPPDGGPDVQGSPPPGPTVVIKRDPPKPSPRPRPKPTPKPEPGSRMDRPAPPTQGARPGSMLDDTKYDGKRN